MLNERQKKALDLKNSGSTFKEIAIALGVSPSRASQIVNHSKNVILRTEQSKHWIFGLEKKTANALISAGYCSKNSVVDAILSGEIGTYHNSVKGKVPGISHKTIAEIAKWAGINSENDVSILKAIELVKSNGYSVEKKSNTASI